jgi:starch phosphorylase
MATNRKYPFQIAIAGKAHPRDDLGKALVAQIHRQMTELSSQITVAFVPN